MSWPPKCIESEYNYHREVYTIYLYTRNVTILLYYDNNEYTYGL